MSNHKRPRGRPRGTGKNDSPYLALVADILIREPSLKPTTAMKRIIMMRYDWLETDETLIRRWQVKWKSTGDSLLTAARERARPPLNAVPTRPTDMTWMLAIRNMQDSSLNKMMRDIANSPLHKMMQEIANSPLNKMMQDIANSPINKMMRQLRS